MAEDELINSTLLKVWEDEVDIVGRTVTRNISIEISKQNPSDNPLSQAKGGANFDPHDKAQLLIDAAKFVKLSIEIYVLMKAASGTSPKPDDVKKKILSDNKSARITDEVKDKIAEVINFIREKL